MTTYTKNDVPIWMYILTKKQKLKKKKKLLMGTSCLVSVVGCAEIQNDVPIRRYTQKKVVQTNKKIYHK